jgi:hypothetical protein
VRAGVPLSVSEIQAAGDEVHTLVGAALRLTGWNMESYSE